MSHSHGASARIWFRFIHWEPPRGERLMWLVFIGSHNGIPCSLWVMQPHVNTSNMYVDIYAHSQSPSHLQRYLLYIRSIANNSNIAHTHTHTCTIHIYHTNVHHKYIQPQPEAFLAPSPTCGCKPPSGPLRRITDSLDLMRRQWRWPCSLATMIRLSNLEWSMVNAGESSWTAPH